MNINKLISELERIKQEHGNIEVIISDYELGQVTVNKVCAAGLDTSFLMDEKDYESEEGELIALIS